MFFCILSFVSALTFENMQGRIMAGKEKGNTVTIAHKEMVALM
ncbi:MAG: hypothetical protein WBK20_06200 [Spirochaetota bacterium]